MKCNIPLSPIFNESLANCSSIEDLTHFTNYSAALVEGILDSELTKFGCLPRNCHRNEWKANEIFHIPNGQNTSLLDDLTTIGTSSIVLSQYQQKVDIEEEYYLYNFDSFVADVGGYLGLFLGASLLSSLTQLLHILSGAHKPSPTQQS